MDKDLIAILLAIIIMVMLLIVSGLSSQYIETHSPTVKQSIYVANPGLVKGDTKCVNY